MSKLDIFNNFINISKQYRVNFTLVDYKQIVEFLFEIRDQVQDKERADDSIYLTSIILFNYVASMNIVKTTDYIPYIIASFHISYSIHQKNGSELFVENSLDLYNVSSKSVYRAIEHIMLLTDGNLYIPNAIEYVNLLDPNNKNTICDIIILFSLSPKFLYYPQYIIALAVSFMINSEVDQYMDNKFLRSDIPLAVIHDIYHHSIMNYNIASAESHIMESYKKLMDYEYDEATMVKQLASDFYKSTTISPSNVKYNKLVIPNNLTEVASGAYGVITTGTVDGVKIAIKRQIFMDLHEGILEIVLMKSMKHNNIESIKSFLINSNEVQFSMSYQNSTLYTMLKKPMDHLLKDKIKKGIVNGVKYMHSIAIIHMDLKPMNILLTSDGTPKIIDFGFSIAYATNNDNIGYPGTMVYQSLDTLIDSNSPLNDKYDVWSVGMIFLDIYFNKDIKWHHGNNIIEELQNMIVVNKLSVITDYDTRQLLLQMLNPDPILRISMKQITL